MLIDGYLYGWHGDPTSGSGLLRCIDVRDGSVAWEKDLGRAICLSAAGDKLLLLADNGTLCIAQTSPRAYEEISRARVLTFGCWTPPVLCNGRIYCRDRMGTLVCVDVRSK